MTAFNDDIVASIGEWLDDCKDRCNMKLACKGFKAAHWNRTFHNFTLNGENINDFDKKIISMKKAKPYLKTLELYFDKVSDCHFIIDRISKWLSKENATDGIETIDIILGYIIDAFFLQKIIAEIMMHSLAKSVFSATISVQLKEMPLHYVHPTVLQSKPWKLNITVDADCWSCDVMQPLMKNGMIKDLTIVHRNTNNTMPHVIDDELHIALSSKTIDNLKLIVMDIDVLVLSHTIRHWEKQYATMFIEWIGLRNTNAWAKQFNNDDQWKALKRFYLCASPCMHPNATVSHKLSSFLRTTGAKLYLNVNFKIISDPSIITFVRALDLNEVIYVCIHAESQQFHKLTVPLAIIIKHHIEREPCGTKVVIIGSNYSHISFQDATAMLLDAVQDDNMYNLKQIWGHLLAP